MSDWRLTNQIDYLNKKKIVRSDFANFPGRDHEHCSFCWKKFGHSPELLQKGYCTDDAHHWICDGCFNDFKEMFEWNLDLNDRCF